VTSAFTPEQEARIREIAAEAAAAATRVQAAKECGEVIDRRRISPTEIANFLSGHDQEPSA
jgi:hypothetical protein